MFKNLLILIAAMTLIVSCGSKKQDTEENTNTDVPVITLAEFEAKAGDYVDKEIQITGIIDHVCKHGGKRLFMVSDDADLHIDGDERFPEDIVGKEITVNGYVKVFKVDEAYCMKMEEDNIQKHTKGETDKDFYEMKMEQIAEYRKEMADKNVGFLSFYSLQYISHKDAK